MSIKKIINRITHKHNYDMFVNQQMINGGMDKLITRKCSKCGKVKIGTMSQWQ